MQQGDPLGPLTIAKDNSCQDLLINAWCLDDGVVAGPPSSVQHVVDLLQDLGPSLGLHLKCEHFSQGDLSLFPAEMNKSFTPNLAILGAPIGDVPFAHPLLPPKVLLLPYCYPHCRSLAHVILRLLSFCYAFTKLVHIARSTPPSLALDELHVFDQQVRHTFTECQAIHTTDSSWKQAQLSLNRGGLGLCS